MRPINLLPPESAEKNRERRVIGRIALLGLAYLVLLALISVFLAGRVRSAEQTLENQQAVNEQLRVQLASLSDARAIEEEYAANAALIEEALAVDISWGRILNDMGRMIPDRVWLNGFTGTSPPDAESTGGITVGGVGYDIPDVSAWIRALDSVRFASVTGTWVSSVSRGIIGEYEVANYVSQAILTDAAESNRAEERIPEVGS